MRVLLVLLLLVSGCQIVFPLDGPGNASTIVEGSWTLDIVSEDTAGVPQIDRLPFTGDAGLFVAIGDAPPVALDLLPDGTFRFERPPGAPYRISLVRDGLPLEVQGDTPTIAFASKRFGRLDAARVDMPTPISLTSSTTPAGKSVLASSGTWTRLPTDVIAQAVTVDWLQSGRGNRLGFAAEVQPGTDHLYYFELAPEPDAGIYERIARAGTFDQARITNGTPATLAVAPDVVTHDCTARLAARQETEAARLADVLPAGATTSGDWNIEAAPMSALAPHGVEVAAQTAGPAQPKELDLGIAVYSPFPDTALVARMEVSANVSVMHPSALEAARVPVESVHFDLLGKPGSCSDVSLGGEVGIVKDDLELDDVAIREGDQITPAAALELDIDNVEADRVDLYQVRLLEVRNDAGMTVLIERRRYVSNTDSFRIDPGHLEPGKRYVFRVLAERGFPGARDGDYRTISYPHAFSTHVSPQFTITP